MTCEYYEKYKFSNDIVLGKCMVLSDVGDNLKYVLLRPLHHCNNKEMCGIYSCEKRREKIIQEEALKCQQ